MQTTELYVQVFLSVLSAIWVGSRPVHIHTLNESYQSSFGSRPRPSLQLGLWFNRTKQDRCEYTLSIIITVALCVLLCLVLCCLAQQRLYFLRQLRKFNLPQELLIQFYSAIIESVLCSSITVWFGSATKTDIRRLQRTVRTAERIIGAPLPSLQELYTPSEEKG